MPRRKWFDEHKALDWLRKNVNIRYNSGDEIVCDCPSCGGNQKFWVNRVTGQCTCYKCHFGNSLYDLVEFVEGISRKQARLIIGAATGERWGLSDDLTGLFKTISDMSKVLTAGGEPKPQVQIPCAKWFGFSQPEYRAEQEVMTEMYQALVRRGFAWEQIVENRAGWAWGGKFDCRVILPAFVDGRIVFWQAWDYTKQKQIKYDSPRNEDVPVSRQAVIYNLERYAAAEQLVVCEGVFNAWSVDQVGNFGVATFGKAISVVQILKLVTHPAKRIYVGLDDDALEEAVRLYNVLKSFGKDALICRLPAKRDFNDLSLDERRRVLDNAGHPDWFWDNAAQPTKFKVQARS